MCTSNLSLTFRHLIGKNFGCAEFVVSQTSREKHFCIVWPYNLLSCRLLFLTWSPPCIKLVLGEKKEARHR